MDKKKKDETGAILLFTLATIVSVFFIFEMTIFVVEKNIYSLLCCGFAFLGLLILMNIIVTLECEMIRLKSFQNILEEIIKQEKLKV